MLKKFLLLLIALLLASSFPVYSELSHCNNFSAIPATKTGVNGMRRINESWIGVDDTNADFFTLWNDSYETSFNFSYTNLGFRDSRGFAFNRSSRKADRLWFVDRRSNSILEVSGNGLNLTNHTTKGYTLDDTTGIDTLDGNRFALASAT